MILSRLLVILVLAQHAQAQTPVCGDTAACLRLIELKQAATATMSARFEQTKHLSLLNEPLVSRGTFAFRRPSDVLWQIDEPKFTIRIDAHGMHLPDVPGVKEESAAMAPFGQMLRELSGLFTGSLGGLRQTFDVQALPAQDGVDLRLRPKSEQWRRMFTTIEVSFRGADLMIASMHLQEALGDQLTIVFSDVHRNDAIAEAALAKPAVP